MKNVLYISYIFPPMAGGGVYRIVKTLKYLPTFGWNPIVLTVKNHYNWATDPTLFHKLPSDLQIHRTYCLDPFYFYALLDKFGLKFFHKFIEQHIIIPDNKIGWFPSALRKGLQLVKKNNVDVIFSTSPPHSAHVIAYTLKRITGKPWIAEFRDHMSLNPLRKGMPDSRIKIEKRLEARFLKAASRIITISEGLKHDILSAFSFPDEKIVVIHNGFDMKDFQNIKKGLSGKKFVITYTGNFYGTIFPEKFFLALKDLLENGVMKKDEVEVNIIGKIEEKLIGTIRDIKLEEIVKLRGYFSHRETIGWMVNSDLLILYIPPGNEHRGAMTGKIFEYMASGTPILGMVPNGEAKKVIEETGTGFVVNSGDRESISAILKKIYHDFLNRRLFIQPKHNSINNFEATFLTNKLVEVLEKVSK